MKSLSIFLGLILLSIPNILSAQEAKPYMVGVNANRSYATSGDYYGIMTNVFIEKPTKNNGIIGVEMGFNMHSLIENKLYVIDSRNPNERIDMSYRTVMSGMQLGAFTGKQFKIGKKHLFRTDIGPILRLQFNSNDGFGVFYPPAYDIPYPLYSFENKEMYVQRTTFAVGAKGALQYRYQFSEKWQAGLHASAQMDTQGDLFYNYGLMVAARFLR